MSERPTIEHIITMWKLSWNNEFPKRKEDKIFQFTAFFETAKGHGYDSSEHFPPSVLSKVLYATVNDNYKNRANLKIWKSINQDLLDQAFVAFFDLVQMKEGKYVETKRNTTGLPYEPASDIVERPELDRSKLKPVERKATTRLSDEDFLNELERDQDE